MLDGRSWLHHALLMRSATARLLGLLFPILVALATSTLLLVDYLRDLPVICAEGGGCDAIKRTAYAHVFGVPTPAFGVAAFAALGLLALLRNKRGRQLFEWGAGLVGVVGASLIVLQSRLGSFCIFCVITDISAVVVAIASLYRDRLDPPEVSREARREVGALAVVLAFAVPLAVASLKRPILPDVIAQELAKAPKGQIVVVDFADFECPFCRMTHEELEPLLEEHKSQIHLVRELVPLTRIHPHALDAARAACCGELLGKGDAMANSLFAAPVEELTVVGCEHLALTLGLDLTAYRACIADPRTDARIHADREVFDKASVKGDGLPLLWIGDQKLMGAHDRATLEHALETAIARAGS
jgi:uncharacterized membrane protein/predicted DsbA family dithiol-disulfide isomerase